MENLNEDDQAAQPWFGGANDKWKCFGLLSVAATVGFSLWRIRELRRQNTQRQRELRRNQVTIDGVGKYHVHNSLFIREPFVEQDPDQGPRQVEKVFYSLGQGKAHLKMNELEDLLEERQHILCSYFRRRSQRLRLEEQIHELCEEMGIGADLKAEFKEVLKSDRSCGSCLSFLWSGDKRRNGKEIWQILQSCRNTVIREVEQGKLYPFRYPLSEEEKSKK